MGRFEVVSRLSSCSICLVDIDQDTEVSEVKACGHIFHVACLKTWLEQKNECPLCKSPVDCYKAERSLNHNLEARVLLNQLMGLQQPMAEYLTELAEIQQDLEALNAFNRRHQMNLRRNRDYALGILAINVQLRQMQADLIMNRVNMIALRDLH